MSLQLKVLQPQLLSPVWCYILRDADLEPIERIGTGVSIFGGQRPNYGTYSVSVDGQTVSSGSVQSNDQATQQLLGSVSGLPYGSHTAVLTNTGGNPVDIDRIDFQTQIGQSG